MKKVKVCKLAVLLSIFLSFPLTAIQASRCPLAGFDPTSDIDFGSTEIETFKFEKIKGKMGGCKIVSTIGNPVFGKIIEEKNGLIYTPKFEKYNSYAKDFLLLRIKNSSQPPVPKLFTINYSKTDQTADIKSPLYYETPEGVPIVLDLLQGEVGRENIIEITKADVSTDEDSPKFNVDFANSVDKRFGIFSSDVSDDRLTADLIGTSDLISFKREFSIKVHPRNVFYPDIIHEQFINHDNSTREIENCFDYALYDEGGHPPKTTFTINGTKIDATHDIKRNICRLPSDVTADEAHEITVKPDAASPVQPFQLYLHLKSNKDSQKLLKKSRTWFEIIEPGSLREIDLLKKEQLIRGSTAHLKNFTAELTKPVGSEEVTIQNQKLIVQSQYDRYGAIKVHYKVSYSLKNSDKKLTEKDQKETTVYLMFKPGNPKGLIRQKSKSLTLRTVENKPVIINFPAEMSLGKNREYIGFFNKFYRTSNPANGLLKTHDKHSRIYVYYPDLNFTGTDQFSFYAREDASCSQNTKCQHKVTIHVDPDLGKHPPLDVEKVQIKNHQTVIVDLEKLARRKTGDYRFSNFESTSKQYDVSLIGSTNRLQIIPDPNLQLPGDDIITFTAQRPTGKASKGVLLLKSSFNEKDGVTIIPKIEVPIDEDSGKNQIDLSEKIEEESCEPSKTDGIFGDQLISNLGKIQTEASEATFTYQPLPDQNGVDAWSFEINSGATCSGTIHFIIKSLDDGPPQLPEQALEKETMEDQAIEVELSIKSHRDADQVLSFHIRKKPEHGQLSKISEKRYLYMPSPNFAGSDYFTYAVYDTVGFSNEAKVQITVKPVNDGAPVIKDFNLFGTHYIPLDFELKAADPDPEQTSPRFKITSIVSGTGKAIFKINQQPYRFRPMLLDSNRINFVSEAKEITKVKIKYTATDLYNHPDGRESREGIITIHLLPLGVNPLYGKLQTIEQKEKQLSESNSIAYTAELKNSFRSLVMLLTNNFYNNQSDTQSEKFDICQKHYERSLKPMQSFKGLLYKLKLAIPNQAPLIASLRENLGELAFSVAEAINDCPDTSLGTKNERFRTTRPWYELAAGFGHTDARYIVANRFKYGMYGVKSRSSSKILYEKAAQEYRQRGDLIGELKSREALLRIDTRKDASEDRFQLKDDTERFSGSFLAQSKVLSIRSDQELTFKLGHNLGDNLKNARYSIETIPDSKAGNLTLGDKTTPVTSGNQSNLQSADLVFNPDLTFGGMVEINYSASGRYVIGDSSSDVTSDSGAIIIEVLPVKPGLKFYNKSYETFAGNPIAIQLWSQDSTNDLLSGPFVSQFKTNIQDSLIQSRSIGDYRNIAKFYIQESGQGSSTISFSTQDKSGLFETIDEPTIYLNVDSKENLEPTTDIFEIKPNTSIALPSRVFPLTKNEKSKAVLFCINKACNQDTTTDSEKNWQVRLNQKSRQAEFEILRESWEGVADIRLFSPRKLNGKDVTPDVNFYVVYKKPYLLDAFDESFTIDYGSMKLIPLVKDVKHRDNQFQILNQNSFGERVEMKHGKFIIYQPAEGFSGTESIKYRNLVNNKEGTITINVKTATPQKLVSTDKTETAETSGKQTQPKQDLASRFVHTYLLEAFNTRRAAKTAWIWYGDINLVFNPSPVKSDPKLARIAGRLDKNKNFKMITAGYDFTDELSVGLSVLDFGKISGTLDNFDYFGTPGDTADDVTIESVHYRRMFYSLYYYPISAFYLGFGYLDGSFIVEYNENGSSTSTIDSLNFSDPFLQVGLTADFLLFYGSFPNIGIEESDMEEGRVRKSLSLNAQLSLPMNQQGPEAWSWAIGLGIRFR